MIVVRVLVWIATWVSGLAILPMIMKPYGATGDAMILIAIAWTVAVMFLAVLTEEHF